VDVSSELEGDDVPAEVQTRNRFLERLEQGPVIVADGGMGALLSAAVPRLRSPEEANLRAPDAVVTTTFAAGRSARPASSRLSPW